MTANYHTHTWRCNHACGAEREYVEQAIKGGLKLLGFSDHTPYPFPDGYQSSFRMRIDQFEDYVTTVLDLKKEYQGEIDIHLGVEAEYYPTYFSRLREFVSGYPVEYFLLGQHYLGDERGEPHSGTLTTDERLLERYCRQVSEGMETGCFTYLAHPDLPCFRGDDSVYEKHMRALCKTAKRCHIPLEINFLGIQEKGYYPNERFWKLAGEENCEVVFGADAHQPESVWKPEIYEKAQAIVRRYDLNLIETVDLRKPF